MLCDIVSNSLEELFKKDADQPNCRASLQPPEKALASPPVRDILPSPRLPLHLTLQTNMASLPEEGTLFQGVRGNGEFHHSLGKRGMSGNSTTLVNWILTHETVWPV